MKKETGRSATESWSTGMSKPVFRKGIVRYIDTASIREAPSAMSKPILDVVEGMEVEVLEEIAGFYKVCLFGTIVGYIPSHFVKEVRNDG